MAEASNTLQLAQLRTRLHIATRTLALLAATNATKHQIRAQGHKVSEFTLAQLRTRAEAYLEDHRADLIPEAAALVATSHRT
jgi:hypothetical protein